MKKQLEYNKDFYAWALHTATLIRQRKFAEMDIENIAEEIEGMGRAEKRQFINRLSLLITHLLKWQYQPLRRSKSWKLTVKEQRIRLMQLLEDSPSLKYDITSKLSDAYIQGVVTAEIETGLDEDAFPAECPFTLEQCLDHQFFPEN